MALSIQSGSAGSASQWKYDVFLSFQDEDTRKGFADHLYHKLEWQGIKTFMDDGSHGRGTVISQEHLSAIEQSRFAIVVLSPNYATSTWCLLELSKIIACMRQRGTILPIFFEVEPSHVRHQRGSFAEAFEEHEEKFEVSSEEVQGWRDCLTKVANFAGWSSKDYRYERELIGEVVNELWSKVHPSLTVFGSSEKLVGMDSKLQEIDLLLDKEANDVRFIGIWGMGGLGKTTLARLVYEKISHQFEVCIFLANVREVYASTHGLLHLQKQIISQILKKENVQVWDDYSGITMISRCFSTKSVLLVLDDVDQSKQLEYLAREKHCFGLRSRIIITTRNRHLLVRHGVEKPYDLKGLKEDEALELFSWKAFRKSRPEENFALLSKSFVEYAGGLPLALATLGSFLYKRSQESWSSALHKLQQSPNRAVFEILKISFDGLEKLEKKIFLDIACFRRLYVDNESMVELLYSSDSCSRIAVEVLVEKSLLTILSDNHVVMHDLIHEMGCEIEREENEEPGKRNRLWLRNDIFHVFTKNTGTEAIEGILLHLDELEEADWNIEAFSKMCKLKLLYIHNLRLSLGPKYLSNALRYLNWSWYPSKSLPPGFQPDELTELSLVHSNIDHLWKGIKYLGKLKSIDLSYSISLTMTPDFTGIPNLEKLVLKGCTNLVMIHPSIALLKRLKMLNFRNCKNIKSLPSEVNMEYLESFDVCGCSKLKVIPEFVGKTKKLSKLGIGGIAVEILPSSIEYLRESLVDLDLSGTVIREHPYTLFLKQNLMMSSFGFFPRKTNHPLVPLLASLKHFSCLRDLNLNNCNLDEGEIPNDIGSLSSLVNLRLSGNNFVSLPTSIHLLSKLDFINLANCKRLQQLPDLPVNVWLWVNTCNSMVGNQDSSYVFYSLLKRLLEQNPWDPSTFGRLSLEIPASEIPEWFNNQSLGDSVTVKLPSFPCDDDWTGVAVCALFGHQDNPSAIPKDSEFEFRSPEDDEKMVCGYYRCDGFYLGGVGKIEQQILSDHLWLVVFARRYFWKADNYMKETYEVKFCFPTGKCLNVKKCGVRALCKQDMEELISKMNQSKSSSSLYQAMDEQEGAMVKATPGNSDDEYYSAEE